MMARATRLPEIQIHDEGIGFELIAPGEALVQLADAFSGAVLSVEVTPDDGSVFVVRVTRGPVVISHDGTNVSAVGGRAELDGFGAWLRSVVAAAPEEPPAIPYHAHLEHYPEHPWLAASSDPVVITMSDCSP
jgi:hypothetical protein